MNAVNQFAAFANKLCNLADGTGYSVLFAAAVGFILLAAYHCRRCY